jgi:hypothetical protein
MKKKENCLIFLQSISLGYNKLLTSYKNFTQHSLQPMKRTAFNSVVTPFKKVFHYNDNHFEQQKHPYSYKMAFMAILNEHCA